MTLFLLATHDHNLLDGAGSIARSADGHYGRATHVRFGQPLNRGGHCGTEHERLSIHKPIKTCFSGFVVRLVIGRHVLKNRLNLGLKTHINHAVGFIQHNVGTLR